MTRSDGDDPRDGDFEPEPFEIPIEDTLDLHPFRPRDIRDVVADYLDAAWEKGFAQVRLIHGKGIGVQRNNVRAVLERHPAVADYRDGALGEGTWGATVVNLRPPPDLPDAPRD